MIFVFTNLITLIDNNDIPFGLRRLFSSPLSWVSDIKKDIGSNVYTCVSINYEQLMSMCFTVDLCSCMIYHMRLSPF